jgi:hypothetical protein
LNFYDEVQHHDEVVLDSPTGPAIFRMPIPSSELLTSQEADDLFSAPALLNRSTVESFRKDGKLLALEIDGQSRFPAFQFNFGQHAIRPLVAYANTQMDCLGDPWGPFAWWFSRDRPFGDKTPAHLLSTGKLTKQAIDLSLALDGKGMT